MVVVGERKVKQGFASQYKLAVQNILESHKNRVYKTRRPKSFRSSFFGWTASKDRNNPSLMNDDNCPTSHLPPKRVFLRQRDQCTPNTPSPRCL